MDDEQRRVVAAIGARFAEVRRSRGLTQEQLADLADLDVQAVRRAETGRNALPYSKLFRVARALGVELGHIFDVEVVAPDTEESSAERQLLAAFRALPADRRPWVLRMVRAAAGDDPT